MNMGHVYVYDMEKAARFLKVRGSSLFMCVCVCVYVCVCVCVNMGHVYVCEHGACICGMYMCVNLGHVYVCDREGDRPFEGEKISLKLHMYIQKFFVGRGDVEEGDINTYI